MTDFEIETAFISRLVCKYGGKDTIATLFVQAKKLGVNADCFSDATCKAIWLGVEELFAKPGFDRISMFSVKNAANAVANKSRDKDLREVEVTTQYLSEIGKGVNKSDPIEGYVDQLIDANFSRKAYESFSRFETDVKCGNKAKEAISSTVVHLQNVLKGAGNDNEIDIGEVGGSLLSGWKETYHHKHELGDKNYCPGLPLPWSEITNKIHGFGKVMTVVAARPGVGKTSFAVALIRYWLDNGIKVVFDSLDMEATELLKRQVAERSGLSAWKFQNGEITPDHWEADFGKAQVAVKELQQLQKDGLYKILCERDAGVLKSTVKILKDQGLVDVLVVDYIQLLKCRGSERMPRAQIVTEVTQILQSIVNEYGIPVLALSQLNRSSEEEGAEPQLHNIKDSGEIEQAASNVLILHPNKALKEKWASTDPPVQFASSESHASYVGKTMSPMYVIVAKARDGETGKIPFVVNQGRCTWYQGDSKASGADQFSRVWDLWKHDPMEESFRKNGALIVSEYEEKKKESIDAFNEKLQQGNLEEASEPVPPVHPQTTMRAPTAAERSLETYDEIEIGPSEPAQPVQTVDLNAHTTDDDPMALDFRNDEPLPF